jgi:hypothetical protein
MIRNRLAAGGLVVGLLGGGIAGAVLGVPGLVGAQDATTTTSTTVAPPNNQGGIAGNGADRKARAEQRLKDALAPLVKNGTITQSQADAVIKALEDAVPPIGGKGPAHGGGFDGAIRGGFGVLRKGLDTVAGTIGVSKDDLLKAIASGQSIADVAKAHNVDPQKVIDALNAQAKTAIDKAVAAGDMTQAQANQALLRTAKAITDMVNGTLPKGMPFGLGHGFGGPGAPGAPGAAGGSTQHD